MSDVKINGGRGVPIVITQTTVYREREVKKKRTWVGILPGAVRIITSVGHWALDRLEESFFEEEIVIVDPGDKVEKHYAIMIDEGSYGAKLDAVQMEHKPPCIHHYEVVRHAEDEEAKVALMTEPRSRKAEQVLSSLRDTNDTVRTRIRDNMRSSGVSDGYFVGDDEFEEGYTEDDGDEPDWDDIREELVVQDAEEVDL